MNISSLGKYALGVTAAAAVLAGCSSGGSQTPLGGSSGMQNAVRSGLGAVSYHGLLTLAARPGVPNVHKYQGLSFMLPDRHHHHKKAMDAYISNFYDGIVDVYKYPSGTAPTGTITGLTDPQGFCTSGKKDYWVVQSGLDEISEFAVGGTTPITSLSETAGEPAGCAIDPSTGNLATSILSNGDVVIYAGAKGTGTVMTTPLVEAFFIGYDPTGDLYVDGFNSSFVPAVVELPKSSTTWESLTTSNSITFPGQVQWDGKWITVNDQSGFAIYQYTQSGTALTLFGTVAYTGATDCVQTWITKGAFICPDAGTNNNGLEYKYPAGGAPTKTLTGTFDTPIGSVVVTK